MGTGGRGGAVPKVSGGRHSGAKAPPVGRSQCAPDWLPAAANLFSPTMCTCLQQPSESAVHLLSPCWAPGRGQGPCPPSSRTWAPVPPCAPVCPLWAWEGRVCPSGVLSSSSPPSSMLTAGPGGRAVGGAGSLSPVHRALQRPQWKGKMTANRYTVGPSDTAL